MAAMGPSERAQFLSRVLGYEKLRGAQELVREQRKLIVAQLSGLRTVLLLSSLEQAAWVLERPADDGEWGELRSWTRGTELVLTDLGIGLTWDEVYAGVGLP